MRVLIFLGLKVLEFIALCLATIPFFFAGNLSRLIISGYWDFKWRGICHYLVFSVFGLLCTIMVVVFTSVIVIGAHEIVKNNWSKAKELENKWRKK